MGEVAEMMLEGMLCEGCGEIMDDMLDDAVEPPGYPRRCPGCSPDRAEPARHQAPKRRNRRNRR